MILPHDSIPLDLIDGLVAWGVEWMFSSMTSAVDLASYIIAALFCLLVPAVISSARWAI